MDTAPETNNFEKGTMGSPSPSNEGNSGTTPHASSSTKNKKMCVSFGANCFIGEKEKVETQDDDNRSKPTDGEASTSGQRPSSSEVPASSSSNPKDDAILASYERIDVPLKRQSQRNEPQTRRSTAFSQAPWANWSKDRRRYTAYGCVSSCFVLAARLWLDLTPTAYLIHSIIVFLDMVLIHLFTNSPWLSISGELTTILFFLLFHFTKETLYELLETTCIAILCSFHLIENRNQHKERHEELSVGLEQIQRQTIALLNKEEEERSLRTIHRHTSILLHDIEALEGDEEYSDDDDQDLELTEFHKNRAKFLPWKKTPEEHEECKRKMKLFGRDFFEFFLDGSAGVMYTSFLGLIIDEIIKNAKGIEGSY